MVAFVTATAPQLRVIVVGAVSDCLAVTLASYSPAEGDRVEVAPFGQGLLIRGRA